MCGIVGVLSRSGSADTYSGSLDKARQKLSKRGPDRQGTYVHNKVGLGHSRLSIIDISDAGAQPMKDASERYVIVYNGEIYNFKTLKDELLRDGVKFHSESDTEVLLNLYIKEGPECLKRINGFFAFAIYDTIKETLFLARDRMGIKPLLVYSDEDKIIFSSEMKAILEFPVSKELDDAAMKFYFQLNYIPAPATIFKQVEKLQPGNYMFIDRTGNITKHTYYTICEESVTDSTMSYDRAKANLFSLLETSVTKRMIADVPLGAFLSGGIDSSVIVALASRQTDHLNTFSIGYADEPYFDETQYANLVAEKFKTNHTVFSLTNNELYQHLFDILDYIDEPFADSSAIAVYILSKKTRSKVTVALSGDGADELFAGYNKHLAEYRARKNNLLNTALKINEPVLNKLPKSRSSAAGNLIRQLHRYSAGLKLNKKERYWRWCSYIDERETGEILAYSLRSDALDKYDRLKAQYLKMITPNGSLNDSLLADLQLVLPNDMLTKVDMMSMANGLEVRVPFLDHDVVDFVTGLPVEYKINNGFRKRILKDAFKDILPGELYHRPKRGFEVPLLRWFKNELKGLINDDLLSTDFIINQGIFNVTYIENLKKRLFSGNPGEVHAQIWALVVFQYWWKKYLG